MQICSLTSTILPSITNSLRRLSTKHRQKTIKSCLTVITSGFICRWMIFLHVAAAFEVYPAHTVILIQTKGLFKISSGTVPVSGFVGLQTLAEYPYKLGKIGTYRGIAIIQDLKHGYRLLLALYPNPVDLTEMDLGD